MMPRSSKAATRDACAGSALRTTSVGQERTLGRAKAADPGVAPDERKAKRPPKKNGNSTDCGDPSCLSNPIARLRGRHLVYRRDEIFTELKVILVSRLPPAAKDDFDGFQ